MSQYTQGKVTAKALERAIKTSIKREISARGINVTTRRGNKELKFLTEKIAGYSFENIEQARIAGEKLGQYLAELFQQKKKPNLDGGLIRQVTFQKNIWSLAGLLVEETHSEETVSLKEGASQITATETIAEDQQMTIEEVAIEESEERSVKDYLAQELSDKSETTEQVEEITSQDSGVETTEESSPTSEAETNVAAEAGLETDGLS